MQNKILIVGTVRNCSRNIRDDVFRIRRAIENNHLTQWLIIESDSDDDTVEALKQINEDNDNFRFISLGKIADRVPLRTARIAYCRNVYVDEIVSNPLYVNIDYVIVADFDGINTKISKSSIDNCWLRAGWDMCSANQLGPYYDIWALRHISWCPNDCWSQLAFLNGFAGSYFRRKLNFYASVASRKITVPPDSEWIPVDSAFGGFAIYRKECFNYARYVGLTQDGSEICEHVTFNQKLIAHGYRLFINPSLINADYTEHTRRNLIKYKLQSLFIRVGCTFLRLFGYDVKFHINK